MRVEYAELGCGGCSRQDVPDKLQRYNLCPDCAQALSSPLHVLQWRARRQLDQATEQLVKAQALVDRYQRRMWRLSLMWAVAGCLIGLVVTLAMFSSGKETVQCRDGAMSG
jgi:hypothetical protein